MAAKKNPRTTKLGRAASKAIYKRKAGRIGDKEAREQALKSTGPRKLKKKKK